LSGIELGRVNLSDRIYYLAQFGGTERLHFKGCTTEFTEFVEVI
jgi:hypothetical protein